MRRSFTEIVSPVASAHGKCVGNRDRTRRCAQRRLQDHRAVQVAPADFGRAGDPEEPVPRLLAEEATEGRGAVEPWAAEPVDRAIPTDQCSAVPIRQERIVSNRGRGHVNSFARAGRPARLGSQTRDELSHDLRRWSWSAWRARRSVQPTWRALQCHRWCQPSAAPARSGRSLRPKRSARRTSPTPGRLSSGGRPAASHILAVELRSARWGESGQSTS